jgi:hypothetical protein
MFLKERDPAHREVWIVGDLLRSIESDPEGIITEAYIFLFTYWLVYLFIFGSTRV